MAWSTRAVLIRLRELERRVPLPAGAGTQSATVRGLANFAADARCLRAITVRVLDAAVAPVPDRMFGDDGYRSEARRDALEALAWGERWADWREKNDWSDRLCSFGDRIPD